MNYSCVIVDDEPLAHRILLEYAGRITHLSVVQQFYSSTEALSYLSGRPPDILFLDIEMPEITGINLLKQLPHKPITIFITAFLDYSLEGFELGVMDYLVKPVRFERFELAVSRAIQFLQLQKLQHELEGRKDTESTLLIKTGNKRISVKRTTITHVQAMKDYVIIYCSNDKYVVRSTMKEIEELLGAYEFMRVHKSFIIARDKMSFYGGNKIEFGGFEIPVGRKYKTVVENYLAKDK
jgi:DNA-binding LytR/AlgR family response regulator